MPILRELGFAYDSSIFPVFNHRYGIPHAPRLPCKNDNGLIEVPPSTYPLGTVNIPFCGGIYFRFFPLAMMRRMVQRLTQRGEPVICYLHPWEIDPEQPRIPMSMGLKLRHYWRLGKTAEKLRRLLTEFRFTTIKDLLQL